MSTLIEKYKIKFKKKYFINGIFSFILPNFAFFDIKSKIMNNILGVLTQNMMHS